MEAGLERSLTAFAGVRKIAVGTDRDVALSLKKHLEKKPDAHVLVFDDRTGQQVDLNLAGTADAVLKRYSKKDPDDDKKKDGPGRPKLGVISREVTLLPQHWEWLSAQPGGASVTLRRLVDEAKRKNRVKDQVRQAQEAAYRFMTSMAGNLPAYEQALRLLYTGDRERFEEVLKAWPKDIAAYARGMAAASFVG